MIANSLKYTRIYKKLTISIMSMIISKFNAVDNIINFSNHTLYNKESFA